MTQARFWLIGAAVVGAAASAVAIALLWLVVTRPVVVAEVFSRGL